MAVKCIKILVLVMIELVIFILLSVHANDGAPISFFSSPPPIILLYFLELDNIVYNTIHRCLIDNIEVRCSSIKSTWPFPDFLYETCIF